MYNIFFHDVVCDDIEEQARSLLDQEFRGIVLSVQQQLNGSDCGVFAIAFATSVVFMQDPKGIQFDIPKIFELKYAGMEPLPTTDLQ